MITQDNYIADNKYMGAVELRGLSTDTKPTAGIGNGSVFIEMDTSKIYFFNFDAGEWIEWEYE